MVMNYDDNNDYLYMTFQLESLLGDGRTSRLSSWKVMYR
jgi:hypothetical protein